MKRLLTAQAWAVVLLLLAGSSARATLITVDNLKWTYNFNPSFSNPADKAVYADGNKSAGVNFTNEDTKLAVGSSDLVATNMRTFVFGFSPGTSPEHITGPNGNYFLTLVLNSKDAKGDHTATLKFSGTLKGTMSSQNANVANIPGADAVQVAVLGDFTFTVAMNQYTAPGIPTAAGAGSIGGHVTITNTLRPAEVPEPSTMLLSGLGLTFLGAASWRKRARARGARSL